MDQSNRYASLNLREEDLIAEGRHVLCAYIVKPKAGADRIYPGWRNALNAAA